MSTQASLALVETAVRTVCRRLRQEGETSVEDALWMLAEEISRLSCPPVSPHELNREAE
jgi:hypothetical protein